MRVAVAIVVSLALGLAPAGTAAFASTSTPRTGVWKGKVATTGLSFKVTKGLKSERVGSIGSTGTFPLGCPPKILDIATTLPVLVTALPTAKIARNGSFKAVHGIPGSLVMTFSGRFASRRRASGTVVVDVTGECTATFPWSASR